MTASRSVEVKCPQCGRFLAETDFRTRSVCPSCGWEVSVRSREARRADEASARAGVKYPIGG